MANTWFKVLLLGGGLGGGLFATANIVNFYETRNEALRRAQSLVTTKGIVNIGSGCDWSPSAMAICQLPEVVANLDVHVANNCPKCQEVDLETPFADGEFDVALASHVLEHLANWQGALQEWQRISDHVIVVLPHGIDALHLNPLHKNHFGFAAMRAMQNDKVEVFA